MIKTIHVEPIKNREKYLSTPLLTRAEVEKAMDFVVAQTRANMEYFGSKFPWSATKGLKYPIIENIEWTDGFWTGLLWLCYEYTGDEAFRQRAEQNIDSFLHRVENRIELDHHDLGFLYSPSCVAGYKLVGSEKGKRAGILAADKLMERYNQRPSAPALPGCPACCPTGWRRGPGRSCGPSCGCRFWRMAPTGNSPPCTMWRF